MNLYLRYFDKEILVNSVDEAIAFLSDIPEIEMNADLDADIREYASSNVFYPKRYKIRSRVYFIIIKTDALSMIDFKEKRAVHTPSMITGQDDNEDIRPSVQLTNRLNLIEEGWYQGEINFKRVLLVPGTGKFQYHDTKFVAQCKAASGLECYGRIIAYLRQRVDNRSQFPSAKGKNFKFQYLGRCK